MVRMTPTASAASRLQTACKGNTLSNQCEPRPTGAMIREKSGKPSCGPLFFFWCQTH